MVAADRRVCLLLQHGGSEGHELTSTPTHKRRTLVREVNAQIRRVAGQFGMQDVDLLVLCECEQPECLERVEVPVAVYDQIQGDGDRFVVRAGHEDAADERVIASDGYSVVRPRGPELRLAPSDPIFAPRPLPAA
jgi:hypothetical protein